MCIILIRIYLKIYYYLFMSSFIVTSFWKLDIFSIKKILIEHYHLLTFHLKFTLLSFLRVCNKLLGFAYLYNLSILHMVPYQLLCKHITKTNFLVLNSFHNLIWFDYLNYT